MFIKLIGGMIIILSSSLIGILLANKYIIRIKILKTFRFSIQLLETEIVFTSTPLPYAFNHISSKIDKPWNAFFHEVSENLLKRNFFTMEEAWNSAMNNHLDLPFFKKSDIELIKNFGKVLGKSDTEDQKKHFLLVYAQLDRHEEEAEIEKKKNVKMYKSLGLLLGIAIYIILI
ncbi:MAG: stage III sporulation protein SpoIIIAB [Firmicutes bacterium]|nr:stage III sporulation protein SpoIIIAB [Bacillota bacterium]